MAKKKAVRAGISHDVGEGNYELWVTGASGRGRLWHKYVTAGYAESMRATLQAAMPTYACEVRDARTVQEGVSDGEPG